MNIDKRESVNKVRSYGQIQCWILHIEQLCQGIKGNMGHCMYTLEQKNYKIQKLQIHIYIYILVCKRTSSNDLQKIKLSLKPHYYSTTSLFQFRETLLYISLQPRVVALNAWSPCFHWYVNYVVMVSVRSSNILVSNFLTTNHRNCKS